MASKTALGQVLSQTVEKRSVWLLRNNGCLFIYTQLFPRKPCSQLQPQAAFGQPGQVVGWRWPAATSVHRGSLHRWTLWSAGLAEERYTGVKGLWQPATSHRHCPPGSVLGGFDAAARISRSTFSMGMWSLDPGSATYYLISA